MTSKTSCSNVVSYRKYILENIKQRGWLMILAFISLLVLQTVYTTINTENFLNASPNQNITSYQEQFPHMLNGNYIPSLALMILLLAIACAVSGYAYLHSPEKSDFYHGFPLKRSQWFHISYVSGLLIFVFPYLFASLCTMGIGAAKGILVSSNFTASVLAVLSGILGFIVLYNTAILAMMLTGKLIAGTLAACVLMVYGYMITHLFSDLISRFLDTHYTAYYFETPITIKGILTSILSPITLYSSLVRSTAFSYGSTYFLLLSITIAVVLRFAARHLYQKRPLEAAGKALVYPKAASAIKVLIAVPTALYIGLFADTFHLNTDGKWITFFSLLAVILLCGIIEFIYTQDLRQIFKRKCASLISIAGVAVILAVMQFDLFGYDTWLPEKAKLESMSLYSESFLNYLSYPETSSEITKRTGGNTALYYTLFDENAQQKEFDSIYKLAEEGIRNHNENITPSVSYKEGLEDYITIAIRFNQTNGKSAYRSYLVSQENLLDCLNDLCEDETYRQMLFPAYYIADSDIDSISLSDILSSKPLELTGEQQAAILQAYQTDTLLTDIHKLQDDSPIGSLFMQLKSEKPLPPYDPDLADQRYDVAESINLPLYDTYKNTLHTLESFGYTVCQKIDPADVIQMTHTTFTKFNEDVDYAYPEEKETAVPITDPEEMSELLDRIAYSFYGIAGYKENSSESLEIWLKGDIAARHFSLLEE